MMLRVALFAVTSLAASVYAQDNSSDSDLPSSFPHDYPGKPNGDFSPEWQDCESVASMHACIMVLTEFCNASIGLIQIFS